MILKRKNVERVAESEYAVEKLKRRGFKPLNENGKSERNQESKERSIEEMRVEELRALAKEKGIDSVSSLNKAELLAVLKDVV